MANLGLLDLVTLQHNDLLTGLVEDYTVYAPEASVIPITIRAGTTYEIVSRNVLPTAQFRLVNQGVPSSKSSFKKQVKEMFPIDVQLVVDEAVVKADDRSAGDVLSLEMQGSLQSVINLIGNQTWYGAQADGSNGFVGARAQLVNTASVGGTTNSTTAYALWLNPWGAGYDIGKDGTFAVTPPFKQQVRDSNNNPYMAWVANISFFIGFSVKSAASVYGVTGISTHTTGSGAGYFQNGQNTVYDQSMNDRAAASLVAKIPLVRRNGLTWFMNRTGHFLLQQSRAAINFQTAGTDGTPAWPSRPNLCEGFPVIVTDSITDTENNT